MSRAAPSCAAAQLRSAELAPLRPRRVSAAQRRAAQPPPPRALHRHVAGWLQKPEPAPQQPPPGPADAPQTPPAASSSAARPLERALRFIRPLFKAPLVSYENGCAGCDAAEVLALWEAAGIAPRGATAERVATALCHSFSCAAAYAATDAPPPPPDAVATAPSTPEPTPPRRVLVGFARTVSDGQFAAVVTDVAVAPAWRRRGVGRELLRRLLRATSPPRLAAPGGPLSRDWPDSVAAFPPPAVRPFFARCSFRRDPRYLWMRLGDGTPAEQTQAQQADGEDEGEEALIEPSDDVAAAMTALWTPLPGARRRDA